MRIERKKEAGKNCKKWIYKQNEKGDTDRQKEMQRRGGIGYLTQASLTRKKKCYKILE